jgi:mannose-6-phosphate isomerase-like protein (cupin superfamily)
MSTGGTPPLRLSEQPVHLGLGARAVPQPAFTGMEWYADYAARTAADGDEGRLVSLYAFAQDWDSWEMHPAGDEVVVCVAGEMTVTQELPDGIVRQVTLAAGDYAINAPGVWHTADIAAHATVLFITAGIGTQHRPR